MKDASRVHESEYSELARVLEQLAERAPSIDEAELVSLWPAVERRVLTRVRADRHESTTSDEQRIRNLAWEIGVSVDLFAVHVGALRTLANLLRERGQRLARGKSRAAQPVDG